MWLMLDSVFKEIESIMPFENLRNDEERGKFIVCRLGEKVKVIGISIEYLIREFEKLADMGFTSDTLVFEGCADEMEVIFGCKASRVQIEKVVLVNCLTEKGMRHGTVVGDEVMREAPTFTYVDVPDFKGRGMELIRESGGLLQNLAEAEYVVAMYMYLRLKEKK